MLTQELKKIFRLRPVLAALVLGTLYYSLSLAGHGGTVSALDRMLAQWVQTYGTCFTPADIQDLKGSLEALNAEADQYLASHPIAREYGVTDHEAYLAWTATDTSTARQAQDRMTLLGYLTGPETDDILSRAQVTEYVIGAYERMEKDTADYGYDKWGYDAITPRELAHVKAVFHGPDEAWRCFGPIRDADAAADYAVLALLWLSVLLGPVMTRDRMSGLISLQYASRRGRGLAMTQLAAYLAAALSCATATALFFCVSVLCLGGKAAFLACRMYTFWRAPYCWPNWTVGAWYLVQWAMGTALALAWAGLLFLLSRTSGNYISMLLKLIPAFLLLRRVTSRTLTNCFYFSNRLYQTTKVPYIELAVPAALLISALSLCLGYVRRIRRRDELTP